MNVRDVLFTLIAIGSIVLMCLALLLPQPASQAPQQCAQQRSVR